MGVFCRYGRVKPEARRTDATRHCSICHLYNCPYQLFRNPTAAAHGVSRYNSDAMRMIAGHHSQQISEILGYEYGPVAVHRDDMIIR